ncbi:MAG: DUF4011 domain-containing protein, partial [Acidobacteriota bacterium]|nr:DUF4011 domain-containing protein [Acidobacteriota bacterium]
MIASHDSLIPSAGNLSPAHEQRIALTVDNWKRKLLDLSGRNRAINFKVNKVSTIAVVDEEPAEIFRLLQQQRKALKFKPKPETAPRAETQPDDAVAASATMSGQTLSKIAAESAAAWEDLEAAPSARDFMPYAAESLDARHTDDMLQTASTPEALDRSLRRLEEQARSVIEEQGVNALFLSLGMLHYKESDSSAEVLRAP